VKSAQKASGFAVAGVAVVIDREAGSVRVAINGVGAMAYRTTAVEAELQGRDWTPEAIVAASRKAAEGVDPLGDIHASGDYRAHLAQVNTRKALELAMSR
jgi:carbon-monoxide dehydrogenase medium subunit